MISYVSCSPELLYGRGGYYDSEVPLAGFMETARSGSADIELLSLVTPSETYPRPAAVVRGPDAEFNESLNQHFDAIRTGFASAAASAMVALSDCIVCDSVITLVGGANQNIVFETYRQNDRPWVKHFDPEIFDPSSAQVYPDDERTVLYLGSVGSSNYGHWLVDDLARLAKLDFQLGPVTIIMPVFGTRIDAVRAEAIGLLANGADLKIEFVDPRTPLRFAKLSYVTPVSYHPYVKSPSAMNFVRELGRRISEAGSGARGERLFVTRSEARHRKLLNLDEVSQLLGGLGFETIDVEDMTFTQQAERFSHAKTVVGVMGAAMTNAIFAPSGARIIHLAPDGWREAFYWDLGGTLGHAYTVLYGATQAASVAHGADFVIDCQQLRGLVEE